MYGVGYHHSGIAPQGRRAVEILVKQGALRFCVATMGLSIGINFSVRATAISDYRRPGEAGFTQYSSSEVLQMLGRAGRRGRDAVGFSLWPSAQSFYKLGNVIREECSSRLKNDPTTFLGLCGRNFKLKDIESFYEKSFLKFGAKKTRFNLIRTEPLKKKLKVEQLPCQSPAHEYGLFEESIGLCLKCPHQKDCHSQIKRDHQNSLASLHLHLHSLGAINDQEQLTDMGNMGRYFPQAGGLLIARYLEQGEIGPENLLAAAELMSALSLARFKSPNRPEAYRFPFRPKEIEELLEKMYPISLFEELYDPPNQHRDYPVLRDFNPKAGFIVRDWIQGSTWLELRQKVCHEKFAEGDLINVLYRTSTYLQSLVQAGHGGVSRLARELRDQMLRPPLTPEITTEEQSEESEAQT